VVTLIKKLYLTSQKELANFKLANLKGFFFSAKKKLYICKE